MKKQIGTNLKWKSIMESGELDGWQAWGSSINGDAAADAECTCCGHKGLLFHGYQHRLVKLAYAVCPVCDEAITF